MLRNASICSILRPLILPVLIAAPVICTWGCVAKLKLAAANSLMKDVEAAIDQHDDLELVTQAIPTYLLVLEGLRQGDPHNPRLLTTLAQAYTSYATLVEIDDPQRAGRLYQRAKTYGLQALAQDKQLAALLEAPYGQFVQIRAQLKPKEVDRVFWAALSWGAWISTHTQSMAALADLPKVILLMEWVVAQDETLFYASPHVFLGVYQAAVPAALGGNPEQSLYHFDRALALTKGQALMVYVQKARFYARQVFDRPLYESLLNQVLILPVDSNPDLILQNMAARKLAKQLLEETDEIF